VLSDREAAKVFSITRATAATRLKRDGIQDRAHCAHTLRTTLSTGQEAIVLTRNQTLYLPIDVLLYITRQYINADVSRSGLARLLKREGMARLEDVIRPAEGATIRAKNIFKKLQARFCSHRHQVPAADARRDLAPYFFVAIDRATLWVLLHIYHDMSDTSNIGFLNSLK
jgi:hypothetical protein